MPLMMHYFPNKIAGVSNAAVEADHFLMTKLMKEATSSSASSGGRPSAYRPPKSCEALQLKQMRWPGGDLPDDAPFQWVEGEYIKADEVDQFLADPNGFAMRTILPRIAGIFQPLSFIQFPPTYWLANAYSTILLAPFLSAPGMKEMFEGMAAFAADAQDYMAAEGAYWGEMAAMGYPCPFVGVGFPAFDLVSDYFRSLRGSTLDMFRQPDKLLAMIDLMLPASINLIIGACKATNTTRAFIPMHRGAGGFMSDEQFEKFYWPSFSALIYACIENGITPMPLFEGDYTPRLKYLATLPPARSRRTWTRSTARSSRRCAATSCASGATSRRRSWRLGRRSRSRTTSRNSSTCSATRARSSSTALSGIPDESRPENILALKEAVDEYGVL